MPWPEWALHRRPANANTVAMNYRHAYHAGNFADVVKHAILALLLEHLKAKDKPFRVIDTHAGMGLYDLTATEAGKTGNGRAASASCCAAMASRPSTCPASSQRRWRPIWRRSLPPIPTAS